MAQSQVLKTFNSLPNWSKGVLAIGGVLIGYVIYTRIRNSLNAAKDAKSANASVSAGETDLRNLQNKGVNPTITNSQASALAESIVKQFTGADILLQSYGVVERAFKQLNNNADFLLLKKAFGVRTYDDAFFGQVKNVTLESAIQDELTNGSIESLNKILKSKGITYQI